MPNIDMPLSELKLYKGSSPRPNDFNAYWLAALDEVSATPPETQLKPAEFSLNGFDCHDVFYNGVRGARIHAKLVKPSGKGNLPIALHFHGYTGRSSDWIDYIPYAAAGFCVLAMDCRGQGGLSTDSGGVSGNTQRGHIIRGLQDGADNLLFRQIFLDTVQLTKIAKNLDCTDESKICAYGASQGGGLALAAAALNPEIGMLAPVFPFLCDYRRVWELNLQTQAYKELTDYFRMYDPTHEREDEIFGNLGYIDAANLADRIKGETIFAISLNDDVCPPSTSFAAYNRIEAKKELHIYPNHAHEHLPGFFDKVLQKFQKRFVLG